MRPSVGPGRNLEVTANQDVMNAQEKEAMDRKGDWRRILTFVLRETTDCLVNDRNSRARTVSAPCYNYHGGLGGM